MSNSLAITAAPSVVNRFVLACFVFAALALGEGHANAQGRDESISEL
jgi:hypothetical protein